MHASNAYGTNCFSVDGVHLYKYRGFYLNFEKTTGNKPRLFYLKISERIKFTPALITFIDTSTQNSKKHSTWGVVAKSDPIDILALSTKARYEIRSGEKKYSIQKLVLNESLISKIKEIYKLSFIKYGTEFSNNQFADYISTLKFSQKYSDVIETWGCYSQNSLIAVAIMGVDQLADIYDLKNLKINYQKSELGLANYFIYFLVNHYLENHPKGIFTTGTTSISHDTKFQEFLCKKLNFSIYPARPTLVSRQTTALFLKGIQFILKLIPVSFQSKKLNLFLEAKIFF